MSTWASWTLLIGGGALPVASSIAVLLGWRPSRLARANAPAPPARRRGCTLYGAVLTDEAARLAEAPRLKACSYIALSLVGCSIVLVILYDLLAGPSRSGRR